MGAFPRPTRSAGCSIDRAEFRPSRVLKLLRNDVLDAAAANHASNVRVFGSVARGDDRVDSDIDLLVTFDSSATLLDHGALLEELNELFGFRVDVISDGALTSRHQRILADAIPL